MNIAIAGYTGLVGSKLVPFLEMNGHRIRRLVRREAVDPENEITWRPKEGFVDVKELEGADVIINLAGENIGTGRWSDEKKQRIFDSRVVGTKLLAETIAKMKQKPGLFLVASAHGYYGDKGDQVVQEDAPPGDTFLSKVCNEWEGATQAAAAAGVRVVNMRISLVLTPEGGFLKPILPLFKFGLGGKLGDGSQYMPWITLEDLVRAAGHCITTDRLSGPVNFCAPLPVTNKEFTKTLGRVLRRPTIFTVPEFALRIVTGEMAPDIMASCQAIPQKLAETEFKFNHGQLEYALREILGRGN